MGMFLKRPARYFSLPITMSGSTVTICGKTVISTMHTTRQKKKGMAAFAMVLLSLPVMFCSTNRLKPTGGVTSAISTSSTGDQTTGTWIGSRATRRSIFSDDAVDWLLTNQASTTELSATKGISPGPRRPPVIIDESDGELDSFVQVRGRGYAGVSSRTCKGIYKSVPSAARCAKWNEEAGREACFMSAEDLTTQAGLSVQQDLALVNLLGITHVERNGHHYVDGMAAQSQHEQQAFLAVHPDLCDSNPGAVRLSIRDGRIALGSLAAPGFASGAMPDFTRMTPFR